MSDIANRIVFGRIGEKDYDEIKPVIEFNTMNQELKDFCISVAKNALKTTSDSHISYYKKLAKKIKLELERKRITTFSRPTLFQPSPFLH